ncbi:MAG: T9SS type A sorting domain-containing protein [Bacteroidia bacterium]|nr:T9SS type A sorting domain-containing protein [Bacteroidia bacterium]
MNYFIRIKLVIVLVLSINLCYSQLSSDSAVANSMINCSSCIGDSWFFNGINLSGIPAVQSSSLGSVSNKLYLTDFGFSIPASATIKGVLFAVSTYTCNPMNFFDSEVRLIINNIVSGTNKAITTNFQNTPYPNFYVRNYGDSTDLWGNTLTPTIVNDVNFGLSFEVTHAVSLPGDCFALNGIIASTVTPITFTLPKMTIYYETVTGIIESQSSEGSIIKAYSHDGKMYVNNATSEIIENATIQIYNALGEVIFEEHKTMAPNEIGNLALSNPINGFYFVTISSHKNELIFSKKVLIDSN